MSLLSFLLSLIFGRRWVRNATTRVSPFPLVTVRRGRRAICLPETGGRGHLRDDGLIAG